MCALFWYFIVYKLFIHAILSPISPALFFLVPPAKENFIHSSSDSVYISPRWCSIVRHPTIFTRTRPNYWRTSHIAIDISSIFFRFSSSARFISSRINITPLDVRQTFVKHSYKWSTCDYPNFWRVFSSSSYIRDSMQKKVCYATQSINQSINNITTDFQSKACTLQHKHTYLAGSVWLSW